MTVQRLNRFSYRNTSVIDTGSCWDYTSSVEEAAQKRSQQTSLVVPAMPHVFLQLRPPSSSQASLEIEGVVPGGVARPWVPRLLCPQATRHCRQPHQAERTWFSAGSLLHSVPENRFSAAGAYKLLLSEVPHRK